MELHYKKNNLLQEQADAYVVTVFKDKINYQKILKEIDKKLNKKIISFLSTNQTTQELGEITSFPIGTELKAKYLFIIGLGDKKSFGVDQLRSQVANVCRKANSLKLESLAFSLEETFEATGKKK